MVFEERRKADRWESDEVMMDPTKCSWVGWFKSRLANLSYAEYEENMKKPVSCPRTDALSNRSPYPRQAISFGEEWHTCREKEFGLHRRRRRFGACQLAIVIAA